MRATKLDELISSNLKLFVSMAVGFLLFAVVIAGSIFFVVLSGGEQVMVPNTQGRELTHALMELQARELNPRIQLRYSHSPHDRGLVLEQDPSPGTIVRAGRNVRLVVSQGTVINRMENFVGRDIDTVRVDLLTTFAAGGGPILALREPIMFDYSFETPGTIIQQRPEVGANISGPTQVEFVVSRGPQPVLVTVPQLTGFSLDEALEWIGTVGVAFEFAVREAWYGERGETVVDQAPHPGANVAANAAISLTVTAPEALPEDEVFGLFSHTLPLNPFPLPIRLEAQLPLGERRQLIELESPGGIFTVPYRLPIGSVLILSMMGREIHREMANWWN